VTHRIFIRAILPKKYVVIEHASAAGLAASPLIIPRTANKIYRTRAIKDCSHENAVWDNRLHLLSLSYAFVSLSLFCFTPRDRKKERERERERRGEIVSSFCIAYRLRVSREIKPILIAEVPSSSPWIGAYRREEKGARHVKKRVARLAIVVNSAAVTISHRQLSILRVSPLLCNDRYRRDARRIDAGCDSIERDESTASHRMKRTPRARWYLMCPNEIFIIPLSLSLSLPRGCGYILRAIKRSARSIGLENSVIRERQGKMHS